MTPRDRQTAFSGQPDDYAVRRPDTFPMSGGIRKRLAERGVICELVSDSIPY